jgi:hypothetical protein
MWYNTPENIGVIRGGMFKGQIFDDSHPGHVAEVTDGLASVVERPMMRTRVAIFTTHDMIYEGPSPYHHNSWPFTPVWGFKRGRDGLPYGLIRFMRDVQDDIYKRASKALHILTTNKVIMDEGAVEDVDSFAEEIARPDAIIVKRPGKELVINAERELAPAHLSLMNQGISFIQTVSGVTDELLGRTTNATSGVAIQARQEQGSTTSNKLFDNLRYAIQVQGEKQLSLIEQFMSEQKELRITNERGSVDFVTANDGLPENDVVRTKSDFVVSEQAWQASIRQAAVAQLGEMMRNMPPQVIMSMLDLLVDSMDIPNRDEIVKRIRAINGQKDPDQTEPTEEEVAQQQAQQAQQQAQAQMFQAEIAEKMATAQEKTARANKIAAETNKIHADTIGANVTSQQGAFSAAQLIVSSPSLAPLADSLLKEAGWPEFQPPARQGIAPVQQENQNPASAGIN